MLQFAKAVGLEVSLATFGMLDDLILTVRSKTGRAGGFSARVIRQSLFPSKAGSTVSDNFASRS